ncbi:MAG: hypothetical protein AAGA30_08165 [Planctomycetota bacterium]
MLSRNTTGRDVAERGQKIVDRYNSGGATYENSYQQRIEFAKHLLREDARYIREGLSEDEIRLFDLIKQEAMTKVDTLPLA